MRRLLEIEGVTGALCAGKDGLVVASTLASEEEELLGAMAAACFDSSSRYIDQLGMGHVRYALFETPGGAIQVAEAGDMLIVVQCTQRTALGRIRIELARALQRLSQQIGR